MEKDIMFTYSFNKDMLSTYTVQVVALIVGA